MALDSVVRDLAAQRRANSNLVVDIRVDEKGINKYTLELVDKLGRNGVQAFRFPTLAEKTK